MIEIVKDNIIFEINNSGDHHDQANDKINLLDHGP